MKKLNKTTLLAIVGAGIGVVGGYLYWFYIGCTTGTCAITSSPINSSLYGALMGGLLFSTFTNKKETENDV